MRRAFNISAAVVAVMAQVALAHPGEDHGTREQVLRTWTWDPLVIAGLILSGALYALGVWRLWRGSSGRRAFSAWKVLSFSAGWLSLAVALVSPLHKLGGMLFSAHMAQHEVLMLICAPLLVMGTPLVPMLWAMPMKAREGVGRFFKRKAIARSWRMISAPLAAWIIHGFTLWAWHIPTLYEATISSEFIHALQHTSFLGSAILFWFTLVHGRYGRMGYGAGVLYVFTTALHSSILGALLTFGSKVWYPIYDGRTAAWNLTALEDQQIGGLIMWVPAGVVFIVVGLALFAAWLGESERRLGYSRTEALLQAATGEGDAR